MPSTFNSSLLALTLVRRMCVCLWWWRLCDKATNEKCFNKFSCFYALIIPYHVDYLLKQPSRNPLLSSATPLLIHNLENAHFHTYNTKSVYAPLVLIHSYVRLLACLMNGYSIRIWRCGIVKTELFMTSPRL